MHERRGLTRAFKVVEMTARNPLITRVLKVLTRVLKQAAAEQRQRSESPTCRVTVPFMTVVLKPPILHLSEIVGVTVERQALAQVGQSEG
jgi:hypothetical protein